MDQYSLNQPGQRKAQVRICIRLDLWASKNGSVGKVLASKPDSLCQILDLHERRRFLQIIFQCPLILCAHGLTYMYVCVHTQISKCNKILIKFLFGYSPHLASNGSPCSQPWADQIKSQSNELIWKYQPRLPPFYNHSLWVNHCFVPPLAL